MRIAQIAPPFERVPPERYGGTESVVSTLTEALVRRGHDVTLFASGDSCTSARLVPVVDRSVWHQEVPCQDLTAFVQVTLGTLVRYLDNFDIVHSHLDFHGFSLARLARCPVITTLHGRLDLPELQAVYAEFSEVPLVSISYAQRHPVPEANWFATIYHGIDLDQYAFNPQPGGYLAFLGRISPEKGLAAAIRVALRANMPLKVAARMPLPFTHDPGVRADWEYFKQDVEPLLDLPDVELLGEVDLRGKAELLRDAAAVLFPIDWPEPFGLVMIEALACGTPVIALGNGSVHEIVRDGVTGFVCRSEDELVDAIRRLGDIDRALCREEAERRFSADGMAERYEQVYRRLIADSLTRRTRSSELKYRTG
jgi:glycosyltransferase involved in cell wall biosynthesis